MQLDSPNIVIPLAQNLLYNIYCLGSQLCLRVDMHPKHRPSIVASMPSHVGIEQLWHVRKRDQKRFYIVNSCTGLVMSAKNGIVNLQKMADKDRQLFTFYKPSKKDNRGLVIRMNHAQSKAMCLYGVLLYGEVDANNDNHIFRFEVVKKHGVLQRSTTFQNAHSLKVLSVPKNFEGGDKLIQVQETPEINFSKLWTINLLSNGIYYFIQNLCSRMVIDCRRYPKVCHDKFVQFEYQLWYLEKVADKQFRFRSVLRPNQYLGVKKDEMKQGSFIQLMSGNSPSTYWNFRGSIPNDFVLHQTQPAEKVPRPLPQPVITNNASRVSTSPMTPMMRTSSIPPPPSWVHPHPPSKLSDPASKLVYASRNLTPSQVNIRQPTQLNIEIMPSQSYFKPLAPYRKLSPPSTSIHPQVEVVKMMPSQVSEIRVRPQNNPTETFQTLPNMVTGNTPNMQSISSVTPVLKPPTNLGVIPTYKPQLYRNSSNSTPRLSAISPNQQRSRLA